MTKTKVRQKAWGVFAQNRQPVVDSNDDWPEPVYVITTSREKARRLAAKWHDETVRPVEIRWEVDE